MANITVSIIHQVLKLLLFMMSITLYSYLKCVNSRQLQTFQDPYCMEYDNTMPNVCLQCNMQEGYIQTIINPEFIVCSKLLANNTCLLDSTYQNITGQEITVFTLSERAKATPPQYICQSQVFYGYPCQKYKNRTTPPNIKSASNNFNFTLIRNQVTLDSVDYYCEKCPQDYSPTLTYLDAVKLYYVGCEADLKCDLYSYFNDSQQTCEICSDLFENCLSCNSTQCLVCPLGFYFNPKVFDYRSMSYQGKCIFDTCPIGQCTDQFGYQCQTSQLSNCLRCQDISGSQSCVECQPGYYLNQTSECEQQTTSIDTRDRFVRPPTSDEYLITTSLNTNIGLTLETATFSISKVLNDIYDSILNDTYSGANLKIYLFSGTHFHFYCTGDIKEQNLIQMYPQLQNFCKELNLYRRDSPTDNINITISSLSCNLNTSIGQQNIDLFFEVCTNGLVQVHVNSQYSYFNISGSMNFRSLQFFGYNSLARDPSNFVDFSQIPFQLCNFTTNPALNQTTLLIEEVQPPGLNLNFTCQDSYTDPIFSTSINSKCIQNQGSQHNQQIESSLRFARSYDDSDFFFQYNGVYTKRQKTLFTLYSFADYQSTGSVTPSLYINMNQVNNFYGDFDSLINIEQGSLTKTSFKNYDYYIYNGGQTGGNITIYESTISYSRFNRGIIFSRKLTYNLEYSMNFINRTLIYQSNYYSNYTQQSIAVYQTWIYACNHLTKEVALASADQLHYSTISANVYQQIHLQKPIHKGIFINVEDYPGSIVLYNNFIMYNLNYLSEFNNTITFESERVPMSDFRYYLADGSSEYKLSYCNPLSLTRYMFGHGFFGDEKNYIEQYFDKFESLSVLYLSRVSGMIQIYGNSFYNNSGIFGGAVTINTPSFSLLPITTLPFVYIENNYFNQNMAYLSGNAVFVRCATNLTSLNTYCGAGVNINSNSFSYNIGTKLSNGGAVSVICSYLTFKDHIQSTSIIPDIHYSLQWIYIWIEGKQNQVQQTLYLQSMQMSQNTFSNNMAGKNGSAVYLYQIANTNHTYNNYINNTAVNSVLESIYSPFYTILSKGIPFTFYDQIYGFEDEFDFMLWKDYNASQLATLMSPELDGNYRFDHPQIKGALHISFCQTEYCFLNISAQYQTFSDIFSVYIQNDIGIVLIDNYNSHTSSYIYISGGQQITFEKGDFELNYNTWISTFSQFQEKFSSYDSLDSIWLGQSSLINIQFNNIDLGLQFQTQIAFQSCSFHNLVNSQFNIGSTLGLIYYRGQIIRYESNEMTSTHTINQIQILSCLIFNNTFIGPETSQIYIQEVQLQLQNTNVLMNGLIAPEAINENDNTQQPEYLWQSQQYGVFWIKTTTNYICSDNCQLNQVFQLNNFTFCYALSGTTFYMQIANQYYAFILVTMSYSVTAFGGLVSVEEQNLLSFNIIYIQDCTMEWIYGTVYKIQNLNQNSIPTSIFYSYSNYLKDCYFNQETIAMNLKNINIVIFEMLTVQMTLYIQDITVTVTSDPSKTPTTRQGSRAKYIQYQCYQYLQGIIENPNSDDCYSVRFPDLISVLKPKLYNYQQYYISMDNLNYEANSETTLPSSLPWFSQFVLDLEQSYPIIDSQHLQNSLHFINCSMMNLYTSLGYIKISNSKLIINGGYVITSAVFKEGLISITQNSQAYIQNTGFYDNSCSTELGSIIYIEDSNLTFYQTQFIQNNMLQCSLLTIYGKSSLVINSSFIQNNTVKQYLINAPASDQITIYNSTFTKNQCMQGDILVVSTTVNISQSIFQDSFSSYQITSYESVIYYDSNTVIFTGDSFGMFNVITGLFYIQQGSKFELSQSSFIQVQTEQVAIAQVLQNSSIEILNSYFYNCSGNITLVSLDYSNQTSVINGSIFDSIQGKAIIFEDTSLVVINTTFINGIGISIQGNQNSTLAINNSVFNSLQGQAVYCLCFMLMLDENVFQNISSQSGGAIYLTQFYLNVVSKNNFLQILNNQFINNKAENGGAIFIYGVVGMIIQENTFKNNKAYGLALASGGALYIRCNNSDQNIQVTKIQIALLSNRFLTNFAEGQGGAIFWASSGVLDYEQNMFQDNLANYGMDIASFANSFNVSIGESNQLRQLNSQTQYLLFPGGNIQFQVQLIDIFNQRVQSDNTSQALIYPLTSNVAFINNKQQTSQGLISFNITIGATPGTMILMAIQFINLETYDTGILQFSQQLNQSILITQCEEGYYFTGSACYTCQSNTYLMYVNGVSSCVTCPTGAWCTGNTLIYPNAGYQRSQFNGDSFFSCPQASSCLNATSLQVNGTCMISYESIGCAACSQGYGILSFLQYHCTDCSHNIYPLIYLAIFLVISLAIIALMKENLANEHRYLSQLTINLKILLSHLQVFALINFVQSMEETSTLIQKVFINWTIIFYPQNYIDCLLQSYRHIIPTFYLKLIVFALFLLLIILVSVLIVEFKKIQHMLKSNTRSQSLSAINLKQYLFELIYCMHTVYNPVITRQIMMIFNCIQIDTQSRLKESIADRCYTREHFAYVTFVAVPMIFIWFIGYYILVYLIVREKNNQSNQNLNRILLYPYSKKKYYWEIVVSLKMTLIIVASSLLDSTSSDIQAWTILFFLIINLFLQINLKPYWHKRLNRMKEGSLISLTITFYLQLFFTNTVSTDSGRLFVSILQVIPTIFYILYWFNHQRQELVRELFIRRNYTAIPILTLRKFSPLDFYYKYLESIKAFSISYQNGVLTIYFDPQKTLKLSQQQEILTLEFPLHEADWLQHQLREVKVLDIFTYLKNNSKRRQVQLVPSTPNFEMEAYVKEIQQVKRKKVEK